MLQRKNFRLRMQAPNKNLVALIRSLVLAQSPEKLARHVFVTKPFAVPLVAVFSAQSWCQSPEPKTLFAISAGTGPRPQTLLAAALAPTGARRRLRISRFPEVQTNRIVT